MYNKEMLERFVSFMESHYNDEANLIDENHPKDSQRKLFYKIFNEKCLELISAIAEGKTSDKVIAECAQIANLALLIAGLEDIKEGNGDSNE